MIGVAAVYISDAACDAYGENPRILKNYQKTYNIDTDTIRKGLVNTLLSLEGPRNTPAGEPKESFQQHKESVRLPWVHRRYRAGDYRVNL